MSRVNAALRVALVLLAGSGIVRSGPAQAQDAGIPAALSGYQGSASASGVRAYYNPSGLLPIAAPVDLGAPDALATIASGPSTFARSSVADPGDLLANPSAILGLAEPSLSGSLPAYPYRVSATSALGPPTSEVSPAPGLNARVKADDSGSSGSATMPALEGPAVLTVGTLAAAASTTLHDGTVSVHARTSLSGIDLLGLLHIDSVVTDLTATSGDGPPKLTGGTTVTGATIQGQRVTIDADGIHTGNGSSGSNPLIDAIDDALSRAGIRVWVAEPVNQAGGTAAQLTSAGLRIDLDLSTKSYPIIGQLFDLLPPLEAPVPGLPGIEDVLALVQVRNLSTIAVGGASVSLKVTTLGATTELPPSIDGGTDLPTYTAPAGAGFTLDPIALPTAPSSPGRAVPASERSPVGFGEGVGALALVALLFQPLLGDRLARWVTTLLAPEGASPCPQEGRR